MRTLVTHIRPHLDDLCGMWLLSRYTPEHRLSPLMFVPTNANGGDVHDTEAITCVGVGRGKYDEHKGDTGECATSLIWRDVAPHVTKAVEKRALEHIVSWVRDEDTGKLLTMPLREFSVPLIIQGEFDRTVDSKLAAELGFRILDAILETTQNNVKLEEAWERRIAFTSRFGPAVGLVTSARGTESYAYAQGFDVAAFVSEDGRYHNIRAKATSNVDLTSVHEELKHREPNAGWYFHHSKKMLICGGDHAPGAVPSTLTLDDLIELLK